MRKIFLIIVAICMVIVINAQSVGIGTTSPNASAQLDVTSTTKGLLIPRMTATQRVAIASPVAGLMVYETSTSSFWFYNGSVWNQIGVGGVSPWTVSGSNIYNSNTGNVGIGTSVPNTDALLDINSTTKGVLLPRMTTTQRQAIPTPPNGLMVYDTDKNEFFHYNGVAWRTILNSRMKGWRWWATSTVEII
jgi:hypothetical protein